MQIDLPTPRAAVTPRSIYRLLLTDRHDPIISRQFHYVHLADIITTKLGHGTEVTYLKILYE